MHGCAWTEGTEDACCHASCPNGPSSEHNSCILWNLLNSQEVNAYVCTCLTIKHINSLWIPIMLHTIPHLCSASIYAWWNHFALSFSAYGSEGRFWGWVISLQTNCHSRIWRWTVFDSGPCGLIMSGAKWTEDSLQDYSQQKLSHLTQRSQSNIWFLNCFPFWPFRGSKGLGQSAWSADHNYEYKRKQTATNRQTNNGESGDILHHPVFNATSSQASRFTYISQGHIQPGCKVMSYNRAEIEFTMISDPSRRMLLCSILM